MTSEDIKHQLIIIIILQISAAPLVCDPAISIGWYWYSAIQLVISAHIGLLAGHLQETANKYYNKKFDNLENHGAIQ